jgi:hypothetical protein
MKLSRQNASLVGERGAVGEDGAETGRVYLRLIIAVNSCSWDSFFIPLSWIRSNNQVLLLETDSVGKSSTCLCILSLRVGSNEKSNEEQRDGHSNVSILSVSCD